MKIPALFLSASILLFALFVHGQDPDAIAKKRDLADSLRYEKGEITLRGGLAKIHVPSGFRYLDSADAGTVLEKIWGNPPNSNTLGMLVPADLSVASPDGWAVIITYADDGYVKDDEAATMNYDKLLKQMQDATTQANEKRKKEGYAPIELVGWASPPRYDKATHKMYWAKEYKFGDSPDNTLNYNIRILGRRGVLVLNAVAPMNQLREIEAVTPQIISMVDFQEGHRYVDFKKSTDKVATYGLIGLVAGGLAAKAGFFKLLIPALLAAKKFIIIGIAALGASIKKLFGKKTPEIR
jgi:uncharacterized membrane-anchored protein